MPTRVINLKSLAFAMRKLGSGDAIKAARRGMLVGANRAVATILQPASQKQAYHDGGYTRGWKAAPTERGVAVLNDVGYAPVIEYGRRPGARMPPPRVLRKWVKDKLGVSDKEAAGVAFVVARAISRDGVPGKRILEKNMPKIVKMVRQEALDSLYDEVAKALGRGL